MQNRQYLLSSSLSGVFFLFFIVLKKVTWPNQKTVVKNTGTVLLCSLLIGACIWIFDGVAYSLVQLILSVFK